MGKLSIDYVKETFIKGGGQGYEFNQWIDKIAYKQYQDGYRDCLENMRQEIDLMEVPLFECGNE